MHWLLSVKIYIGSAARCQRIISAIRTHTVTFAIRSQTVTSVLGTSIIGSQTVMSAIECQTVTSVIGTSVIECQTVNIGYWESGKGRITMETVCYNTSHIILR